MSTKTRAPKGDAERSAGKGGGPTALVTFLVGAAIVAYLFFTNPDPKSFEAYNFINTGLCLWLPLLVILFALRQEPSQFGLTRGDQRFGLKWALIAWIAMILPIVYFAHRADVQQYYLQGRLRTWELSGVGYVFNDGNRVNLKALLYYELGMGFYMFCWEFFFRGFLLFGLQKSRLGAWGAIIVQALLFMLIHWSLNAHASKPGLEVLSALPGGIILGWFALRTRTFLYGYLIHWALSVTLDLFLLVPFMFHRFG
ncbi:MAG: CPBP family intramembrane metalloprotease [Armatimonadota bacterium]|nr:CPBP family intramembrane metalloprotease [Armatimonadota bacterium]